VEENLKLASVTLKNRDRDALQRVYDRYPILEACRKTPAGKLSGGEQQMLVIGRALVGRPRLLMLDEPSLGLAPRIVEQVFETLAELQREGTTILLIEQNAAQTVRAADRAWVLAHGEAEQITDTDAVGEEDLIATYLGRGTQRG
jgi:branched-chain amino acid transport system ATP-binding protein